jgi:hypothetical protein
MRINLKRFAQFALLAFIAFSAMAPSCKDITSPQTNRKIGVSNDSRYTIYTGTINGESVISGNLAISDWFICQKRYSDGTWIDYSFSALDPTVYTMHGRFKLPGTTVKFNDLDVSAKIIIGHGVSFAIKYSDGQVENYFVPGKIIQLEGVTNAQP